MPPQTSQHEGALRKAQQYDRTNAIPQTQPGLNITSSEQPSAANDDEEDDEGYDQQNFGYNDDDTDQEEPLNDYPRSIAKKSGMWRKYFLYERIIPWVISTIGPFGSGLAAAKITKIFRWIYEENMYVARIEINRKRCTGAGQCVNFANGAINIDSLNKAYGIGEWSDNITSKMLIDAAKACPNNAISLYNYKGDQIH